MLRQLQDISLEQRVLGRSRKYSSSSARCKSFQLHSVLFAEGGISFALVSISKNKEVIP